VFEKAPICGLFVLLYYDFFILEYSMGFYGMAFQNLKNN